MPSLFLLLICIAFLANHAFAEDECSKTKPCKEGCCSQYGFCGYGNDFCGSDCINSCDGGTLPDAECNANKPCAEGCCSQFGNCGYGDDFCGSGCINSCDQGTLPDTECDANKPCAQGCCSKHGFCGYGKDFCASDVCVNSCDAKADCDPGSFGKNYVKSSSCPLNVCCSEHGFCGTTKDFCGDNEPKRPSCDVKNQPLGRVAGYYEGWALGRPCNKFYPEQIPTGVYTHLHFAFATIDPKTYSLQPATRADIDLYKRLNNLKLADPGLKTTIAVGGWTFNDPGPTATLFSDIANSDTKSDAFVKSVVQFVQKYNFDGIDLDWEYPVAEDRFGRGSDYAAYPKLVKKLKSALKSTGGRDIVSMAVPASYWYLQHFDIKSLEKHLDFFNIMTYDLHGTWDMGSEWVGPYLNAHTNLTEIEQAFDLFWRNGISSDKINMGIGFYGRSFELSDPSCNTPGCEYASGSARQPCSSEVSIMLNSEIVDVIRTTGAKPVLYEKEAVKALTYNGNWVAYDDEETFKMRADFARKFCLGGLMVWAVSHDTESARFSLGLMEAVGRPRTAAAHDDGYVEVTRTHDQCKWSNCLEQCPSGWMRMMRRDGNARDGEYMINEQGCDGRGKRQLCCPANVRPPTCGWYKHNNGRCDPKDHPSGHVEIGSTSMHCRNSYQAATCSVGSDSMRLHDACRWSEKFPSCDDGECPGSRTMQFTSGSGSGGAMCHRRNRSQGFFAVGREQRKYCCDEDEDEQWTNCEWYTSAGYVPSGLEMGTCLGGCPKNKYPLGLDEAGGGCLSGGRARCCESGWKTIYKRYNDEDEEFDFYLNEFMRKATCTDGSDSSSLYRAQQQTITALRSMLYSESPAKSTIDIWNSRVGLQFGSLRFSDVSSYARTTTSAISMGSEAFPKELLCNLHKYDAIISGSGELMCSCGRDSCCHGELCVRNVAQRSPDATDSHARSRLEPRSRELHWEAISSIYGIAFAAVLTARGYPSSGDWRPADPRWNSVYDYASTDCDDTGVTTFMRTPGDNTELVTEHVLELQSLPRFIESTINGRLTTGRASSFNDPVDPYFWLDIVKEPMDSMQEVDGLNQPLQRMLRAFGTTANSDPLLLAHEGLNGKKAKLWALNNPVARTQMQQAIQNLEASTFITNIRDPIAVINYLREGSVRNAMMTAYRTLRDEMGYASNYMLSRRLDWPSIQMPEHGFELAERLDEWFEDFIQAMVANVQNFARGWIDRGTAAWGASNNADRQRVIATLEALWDEIKDFEFDMNGFLGD